MPYTSSRRQKRRGTSVGVNLGGILEGMIGGVEANPDFALASQAQSAPFVKAGSPTQAALMSGAYDKPFKAGSFFDKRATREANANYLADRFAQEEEARRRIDSLKQMMPFQEEHLNRIGRDTNARELEQYPKMTPLIAGRTEETGLAQGRAELTNRTNQYPLDTKIADDATVRQMLSGLGIVPEHRAEYTSEVSPKKVTEAGITSLANTEKQRGLGAQNIINNEITEKTAPDQIATGLSNAALGRSQAGANVAAFPEMFKLKLDEARQQPLMNESQMVRNRFIPMGKDTGLFDANMGKLSYEAPSQFEQGPDGKIQMRMPGVTQAPQTDGNMVGAGYTINDLITDPTTGEILGVKPRRQQQ